MCVCRGGDQNRINFVGCQHGLDRRKHFCSGLLGHGISGGGVDVVNARKRGPRMGGDVCGMHHADAPAAEHSDPDHSFPPDSVEQYSLR